MAGSVTRAASPSMTASASRIDTATERRRSAATLRLFRYPSRFETGTAIEPEGADRSHMRAAVLVHRCEPGRASVVRVRGRRDPAFELVGDCGPVHWRQPVPCTQVDDLHGRFLRGRAQRAQRRVVDQTCRDQPSIAAAGHRAHVQDGHPTNAIGGGRIGLSPRCQFARQRSAADNPSPEVTGCGGGSRPNRGDRRWVQPSSTHRSPPRNSPCEVTAMQGHRAGSAGRHRLDRHRASPLVAAERSEAALWGSSGSDGLSTTAASSAPLPGLSAGVEAS